MGTAPRLRAAARLGARDGVEGVDRLLFSRIQAGERVHNRGEVGVVRTEQLDFERVWCIRTAIPAVKRSQTALVDTWSENRTEG